MRKLRSRKLDIRRESLLFLSNRFHFFNYLTRVGNIRAKKRYDGSERDDDGTGWNRLVCIFMLWVYPCVRVAHVAHVAHDHVHEHARQQAVYEQETMD